MGRTINGKPLEQVMGELLEEFPSEVVKENQAGYAYIPYEYYQERLNRVVGPLAYDFIIGQTSWIDFGGKFHVSCIGTLSLRDDDGNIVAKKSATGDADVIYRNSDGVAVKPGNDAKTASHDAFKSCCRMLGIGDAQLRAARKNKKGGDVNAHTSSGTYSQRGGGNGAENSEEKVYRVVVQGSFKTAGNKGFKAPAVIKDTGEKVTLVLWNREGVKEIEKYMPIANFLQVYRDKEFSLVGVRNTFIPNKGGMEEQLVMLRPCCNKGEEAS